MTRSRARRCRATPSSSTACSISTTPKLKRGRARCRDRPRAVGLRSVAAARAAGASPASRRHGARAIASSSPQRSYLWALDRKTGTPIASFGRDGQIDLREGLGRPAERLTVSASTPGVDLRGHAHHRQQRSRDAARLAGPHPRIRREDRRAALDLSHHSAARRIRIRHMADGGAQGVRRRERLGRRDGRTANAAWSSPRPVRRRSTSTASTGTATTCSPTASWRSTRARASASGISRQSSTTSGTGTSPPRPTSSRSRATAERSTPSRRSRRHGYVYVFDRRTGEPLFPIEYRKVPPSDVDGERAAETQPYPAASRRRSPVNG